MKYSKTILAVAAALALTGGAITVARTMEEGPAPIAASGQWQLLRTAQGTLIHDPFNKAIPTREVQDRYEFNGDTDPALAFVRATDGGLQVGVDPPPDAEAHSGYFAVTHDAYPQSSIFHVRMSKQPGQVQSPAEVGQAVFAVQTASTKVTGLINFIVVSADSTAGLTSWRVGYMEGHLRNASFIYYWGTEPAPEEPDTRDITLRTDGRRTLTLWFGTEQVFHSDQLQMNIQAPYQPYLEVQAVQTPFYSSFQDFWVVEDDHLQLTGVPAGADVKLVDNGGGVLGTAIGSDGGTATVELPPYAAKGSGTLEITEPGREPVRLGAFDYAGGDDYKLASK
ncbi:hypothetical protein M1E17_17640 [Arthrobacter sp. D1-29]